MSEHDDQVALFAWRALAERKHPELALLFAIPNGGKRSKATAGKLRAEGVRAGVPDVCLPVPRGPFAALYIELKRMAQPGKMAGAETATQKQWRIALTAAGNCAVVCKGWVAARDVIQQYLSGAYLAALPEPQSMPLGRPPNQNGEWESNDGWIELRKVRQ